MNATNFQYIDTCLPLIPNLVIVISVPKIEILVPERKFAITKNASVLSEFRFN